jgi:hypothetical protein
MTREKKKEEIPTRFTLNLDYSTAKMLIDLCGFEGRKKNSMVALLIRKEHHKVKGKRGHLVIDSSR